MKTLKSSLRIGITCSQRLLSAEVKSLLAQPVLLGCRPEPSFEYRCSSGGYGAASCHSQAGGRE